MISSTGHYIPAIDPSTSNPTAPISTDQVFYYNKELKSGTVSFLSKETPSSIKTINDSEDPNSLYNQNGSIYIQASTYAQYFMVTGASQACGERATSDSIDPKTFLTQLESINQKIINGKVVCTLRRNGVEGIFTEGSTVAQFLLPSYEIKKDSSTSKFPNSQMFPQYNFSTGKRQVNKILYIMRNECLRKEKATELFIPIEALALGLGSNMFYYIWEMNSYGSPASSYAHGLNADENEWIDNGKVGAVVWDQRVRRNNSNFGPEPLGMHGYYISITRDPSHWQVDWSLIGPREPNASNEKYQKREQLYFDKFLVSHDFSLNSVACPHNKSYGFTSSPYGYYTGGFYGGFAGGYNITPQWIRREAFFIVQPFGGLPRLMQKTYDLLNKYYVSRKFSSVSGVDFKDGQSDGDPFDNDVSETEDEYDGNEDPRVNLACNLNLRCPEYNPLVSTEDYSTHTQGRAGDFGYLKARKVGMSILFDCNVSDLKRVRNGQDGYSETPHNIWFDKRSGGLRWNQTMGGHKILNHNAGGLISDRTETPLEGMPMYTHYFFVPGPPGSSVPAQRERNTQYPIGLMKIEYNYTWFHGEVSPPSYSYYGDTDIEPNGYCP
jgi:hypothetical protein